MYHKTSHRIWKYFCCGKELSSGAACSSSDVTEKYAFTRNIVWSCARNGLVNLVFCLKEKCIA